MLKTRADLVEGFKILLGLNRGGRNFKIYPDDRFLISYPRSGNTWTRFLVANLLFSESEVSFLNIDYLVPDVINITQRELDRIPRPRLIKTHHYFDPRYKKVIYIVRDPRDVVVSYYYFHLKQGFITDGYPMSKFVERFVSGEVDPTYASWGENVASWIATRFRKQDFLLLQYEKMKTKTVSELAKVADFLEIPYDAARLSAAVEKSTAERMRDLEKRDEDRWIGTRAKRKDVRFVRTAVTGGWRSALNSEEVSSIESAWGPLMQSLGYDLQAAQDSVPTLGNEVPEVGRE